MPDRRRTACCPAGLDWCAGGHRCQPLLREHRSDPHTIRTRYGVIVVSMVRQRGRTRLELRTLVDLPAEQPRRLAEMVLLGVHRAIRRITLAGVERMGR